MSRDFTPKIFWQINNNEETKDMCLGNLQIVCNGSTTWLYTEDELVDRRKHRYLAVTGPDVYKPIRDKLTDFEFERFVNTLGKLIEADTAGKSIEEFPTDLADWYLNRNEHYYHEPNDAMLLRYVFSNYTLKPCCTIVRNLIEGIPSDDDDLDMVIDLSKYSSLMECCKDTINNIESDSIFVDAEYNLFGKWKSYKGFTEDDYKYAASCGYEGCWFMNDEEE